MNKLLYCIVIRGAWSPTAASSLSRIPLNNFGRRFGYSRSIRESRTQIGPNRKKEIGKTKNHIGYQNRKTASIFYENRKPDAKTRKIRKPHLTPKPKNRSVLTQKPKNRSKKHPKPQNRKSQCPPHISNWRHTKNVLGSKTSSVLRKTQRKTRSLISRRDSNVCFMFYISL